MGVTDCNALTFTDERRAVSSGGLVARGGLVWRFVQPTT